MDVKVNQFKQNDPVFISIKEATERFPIGKTKLYELIKLGFIQVRRCGKRTMIDFASMKDWAYGLPS